MFKFRISTQNLDTLQNAFRFNLTQELTRIEFKIQDITTQSSTYRAGKERRRYNASVKETLATLDKRKVQINKELQAN